MPGVVVVGAGFAGLAAARRLCQAGISPVIVLEACSAVGGRARTRRLNPGLALEMGATWIHGIMGPQGDPNPMLVTAQDQGLLGPEPPEYVWQDAHFLQPGRTTLLDPEEVRCIEACSNAFTQGVDPAVMPAEAATVADTLAVAWAKFLTKHGSENGRLSATWQALAPALWQWHSRLQCVMDGTDTLDDLSCHVLASYNAHVPDRHVTLPGGYQEVAEKLAKGLDVRLGVRVVNVCWDGSSLGVLVTCEDGTQIPASAAIVTVSLGVLKATHETLFTPRLPKAHLCAMERLRMGTVDKLFIEFVVDGEAAGGDAGIRAWPNDPTGTAGTGGSDEETYALLWEPEQHRDGVGDRTVVPDWARKVFSITFGGAPIKRQVRVTEQTATPTPRSVVAVAWIGGQAAREAEQASDTAVLDGLRQIWRIFPGLPVPEGASWMTARLHRSRWAAEPEFLGSYSYPLDLEAPEELAQPIFSPGAPPGSNPMLLLAGEACAKAFGTAHGALLAGRAAADRLAESFGES